MTTILKQVRGLKGDQKKWASLLKNKHKRKPLKCEHSKIDEGSSEKI